MLTARRPEIRAGLQSGLQKGIVWGLAALCRGLDELPSVGRSYRREDGPPPIPGPAEPVDDLVIDAGGLTLYRHGEWGTRFTPLPLLSAGLDQRWGTGVWDASGRPPAG